MPRLRRVPFSLKSLISSPLTPSRDTFSKSFDTFSAPGEISTPMTDQEDVNPRTVKRPGYPLGRPGDAREVAGLVVFLTTPAAAFITGTSLVIDGGLELMAAIGAHGLQNDDCRKV
ncbi:SDR family oxidoreductase [Cystobacter ferrugineus]|nr:SDR family oxidoreductase [Cystobacter ferrugineus]